MPTILQDASDANRVGAREREIAAMSIAHVQRNNHHDRHDRTPVPFGFLFRGAAGFGAAALVIVGVAAALLGVEAPDYFLLIAGAVGALAGGMLAYVVGRSPSEG